MEKISSASEMEVLEKQYENKLKEGAVLASDFNQFNREGKRADLYHFEKKFEEKSMAFNESINDGIVSEVELFKKLHKEVKSIDDFAESKISKEEMAELYENENKRNKIELFYKKAIELVASLGYKIIKSDEEAISLEKEDKAVEIECQLLQDDKRRDDFVVGRIGGFGRVTYLKVKKGNEQICFFKSRWIQACEDFETKKDIDALIATLS